MLSAIRFLSLAVCDRGFTFVLPDVQIWCVTDGKDLGKTPNFINTAIETKQPAPSPGLRFVLGSQPGPLRSVRESNSEGKPVVGVQPCAWGGEVWGSFVRLPMEDKCPKFCCSCCFPIAAQMKHHTGLSVQFSLSMSLFLEIQEIFACSRDK